MQARSKEDAAHVRETAQSGEFGQNKLKQACAHDDIIGVVNGEREGA